MSFLLAEGHVHARHYPLGMVFDEVRIAADRVNGVIATQAMLTQLVVGSVFSKESAEAFTKQIKRLTNG